MSDHYGTSAALSSSCDSQSEDLCWDDAAMELTPAERSHSDSLAASQTERQANEIEQQCSTVSVSDTQNQHQDDPRNLFETRQAPDNTMLRRSTRLPTRNYSSAVNHEQQVAIRRRLAAYKGSLTQLYKSEQRLSQSDLYLTPLAVFRTHVHSMELSWKNIERSYKALVTLCLEDGDDRLALDYDQDLQIAENNFFQHMRIAEELNDQAQISQQSKILNATVSVTNRPHIPLVTAVDTINAVLPVTADLVTAALEQSGINLPYDGLSPATAQSAGTVVIGERPKGQNTPAKALSFIHAGTGVNASTDQPETQLNRDVHGWLNSNHNNSQSQISIPLEPKSKEFQRIQGEFDTAVAQGTIENYSYRTLKGLRRENELQNEIVPNDSVSNVGSRYHKRATSKASSKVSRVTQSETGRSNIMAARREAELLSLKAEMGKEAEEMKLLEQSRLDAHRAEHEHQERALKVKVKLQEANDNAKLARARLKLLERDAVLRDFAQNKSGEKIQETKNSRISIDPDVPCANASISISDNINVIPVPVSSVSVSRVQMERSAEVPNGRMGGSGVGTPVRATVEVCNAASGKSNVPKFMLVDNGVAGTSYISPSYQPKNDPNVLDKISKYQPSNVNENESVQLDNDASVSIDVHNCQNKATAVNRTAPHSGNVSTFPDTVGNSKDHSIKLTEHELEQPKMENLEPRLHIQAKGGSVSLGHTQSTPGLKVKSMRVARYHTSYSDAPQHNCFEYVDTPVKHSNFIASTARSLNPIKRPVTGRAAELDTIIEEKQDGNDQECAACLQGGPLAAVHYNPRGTPYHLQAGPNPIAIPHPVPVFKSRIQPPFLPRPYGSNGIRATQEHSLVKPPLVPTPIYVPAKQTTELSTVLNPAAIVSPVLSEPEPIYISCNSQRQVTNVYSPDQQQPQNMFEPDDHKQSVTMATQTESHGRKASGEQDRNYNKVIISSPRKITKVREHEVDTDMPDEPEHSSSRNNEICDSRVRGRLISKADTILAQILGTHNDSNSNSILGTGAVTNNIGQSTTTESVWKNVVMRLTLPPQIPEPFTGNPIEFVSFIQTFYDRVHVHDITDSERLNYLLQYTRGTPHTAIRKVKGLQSGYAKALEILNDRYGNSLQIVDKTISQLVDISRLGDNDIIGLRELADNLTQATQLLEQMGRSNEMNSVEHMKRIISVCPTHVQYKWQKRVHELKMIHKRQPTFNDVVQHIEWSAGVSCNSVFKVNRKAIEDSTSSSQGYGKGQNKDRGGNNKTTFRPPNDGSQHNSFENLPGRLGFPQHPRATMLLTDTHYGNTNQQPYGVNQGYTHMSENGPYPLHHVAPPPLSNPDYQPLTARFQSPMQLQQTYRKPVLNPNKQQQPNKNHTNPTGPSIVRPFKEAAYKCIYCGGIGHRIYSCGSFMKLNLGERQKHVESNNWCTNCLGMHLTEKCQSKATCTKCGRNHHTLLHPLSSTPAHQSMHPKPREGEIGLLVNTEYLEGAMVPVIPVLIKFMDRIPITTFAILDGGSTTCFLDKGVVDLMNLPSEKRFIKVNTLLENGVLVEIARTQCTISAMLPGYHGELVMNNMNVHESMHFDTQLPDSRMIDWPHFYNIRDKLDYPPVDVHKISVILGSNVPAAHIRTAQCWGSDVNKQPFAIEGIFGWCVTGPRLCYIEESMQACVGEVMDNPSLIETLNKPIYDPINYPISTDPDNDLYTQLAHFWSQEGQGFTTPEGKVYKTESDKRAINLLEKAVLLPTGHYQVPLLFKHEDRQLINNKPLAIARLKSLTKRFATNPGRENEYREILEDYIAKGYARKLETEELADDHNAYYLPHHYVVNPNKDKIRIVFDAAATYKGMSLNSQLLEGPNATNDLLGVLMRFRQDKIAFSCDIECMFYQVNTTEEDSNSLRFLWYDKDSKKRDPDVYKMVVQIFGARSSPCSACSMVRKTAKDNIQDFSPQVIKTILSGFYVDDGMKSTGSVNEAYEIATGLIECLKKGGFNLTKFKSNSRELLDKLPQTKRADPNLDLDLDKLPTTRALGVKWDTEADTFSIKVSPRKFPTTKRNCLSSLASIYDKLGLVAPVLLIGKRFMRELSISTPSWDTQLDVEFLTRWNEWSRQLDCLNELSLPRAYFSNRLSSDRIELHIFCDACETGLGAVAYLRQLRRALTEETPNTIINESCKQPQYEVSTAFVLAKTRTARKKFVSIPRKELQSCVLATRMSIIIHDEVELFINATHFWSDSRTSLQYIANQDKRYPTYIINRVGEIVESTNPNQWHHVKGIDNVADMASRGAFPLDFIDKFDLWSKGPQFLQTDELEWPNATQQYTGKDLDPTAEIKSKRKVNDMGPRDDVEPIPTSSIDYAQLHSIDVMITIETPTNTTNLLLDKLLSYYGDWIPLIRTVAWLVRFKMWYIRSFRLRRSLKQRLIPKKKIKVLPKSLCSNAKSVNDKEGTVKPVNKPKKKQTIQVVKRDVLNSLPKPAPKSQYPLTLAEVQDARVLVLKYSQQKTYPTELASLKVNKPIHRNSNIFKLCPFLGEDGLIRMNSRLVKTPTNPDMAQPIILSSSCPVTRLIVRYTHSENMHTGRDHTLAIVRQIYWIVGGPSLVKRIVSRCVPCKVRNPTPLNQIMAPLPIDRITAFEPCFTYTGVDYWGFMLVQQGRRSVKMWGVIFTCLVSRAVALDLAEDLSASTFINCFRRFVCQYGNVKLLRSDNGTNFVGAETELSDAIDHWDVSRIQHNLGPQTKFEFQVPYAPHTSGVWERLNRPAKDALRVALGNKLVTEGVVRTALAEAARIMNSRPLCKVTDDPTADQVLTPNDLLLRKIVSPCPGVYEEGDIYCRKTWKQAQALTEIFWDRWLLEYLPLLRERQKWFTKKRNLQPGDLVLQMTDTKNRRTWITGVIDSVNLGSDGCVRSAQVRCGGTIYSRHVTKLCLLEATITEEETDAKRANEDSADSSDIAHDNNMNAIQ